MHTLNLLPLQLSNQRVLVNMMTYCQRPLAMRQEDIAEGYGARIRATRDQAGDRASESQYGLLLFFITN